MNYLENLLSRLGSVEETADGWLALCPCPDHSSNGFDQNPSLRIAVGNQGKLLLCCRTGCSFQKVLQALQLKASELFPRPGEAPEFSTVDSPVVLSDDEVSKRNAVYQRLLAAMKLSEVDKENLKARGLDDTAIDYGGYRTCNDATLPFLNSFRSSLDSSVPGIDVLGNDKRFNGLWIPVRNLQGYIQAIKIRRLQDPKYIYLSTKENSSTAPCHFVPSPFYKDTLVITEGELKAEVIYSKLSLPVIGVPGVAHWRKSLEWIDFLEPKKVLIAYDFKDLQTKAGVREQAKLLYQTLVRKYEVGLAAWEEEAKGFDDLLVSGGSWQTLEGEEALAVLQIAEEELTEAAGEPQEPSERLEKTFPYDIFPEPMKRFIEDVAAALPCPADFVGMAALTVAGAALGTSRAVEIKQGWLEYAVLYSAVVGPPGCLKSPAIKAALKPILVIEQELFGQQKLAEIAYNQKFKEWKAKNKAYEKNLRKAFELGIPPPAPIEAAPKAPAAETIYVQDITLESMLDVLDASPRGIVDYHDELVSWINGFNQYRGGRGSDAQFFLEIWSPPEQKKVNRKGQPPVIVKRPFVSVLGSIQPDKLSELGGEVGQDDGFLARILLCVPPVNPVPTFNFNSSISEAVSLEWENLVRKLRSYTWIADNKPLVLRPTEEAKEAWQLWHNQHELKGNGKDFDKRFLAFWSKLKAYTARFSLIIHMLRLAVGETEETDLIEKVDIEKAVMLIDYFKEQTITAYDMIESGPQDKHLGDFIKWVKEHGTKVSFEEVWRKKRWGVKGKESAHKLIKLAEDRGLGTFSIKEQMFYVKL